MDTKTTPQDPLLPTKEQSIRTSPGFSKLLMSAKQQYRSPGGNGRKVWKSFMLEKTIKRSKRETMPFPQVREWPWRLKLLSSKTLVQTILTGLIMSLLIIPQSMAYTIMIGVPAQVGVYQAGLAAIVYSLLGSSRHASVGPCTTTFLMIRKAALNSLPKDHSQQDYLSALQEVSLIIGFNLSLMGIFKLGFIENAFSVPAFQGYFKAANFIIFTEQLAKVLAIQLEGENIFAKWSSLFSSLSSTQTYPLCLGITVWVLLSLNKVLQKYLSRPVILLQLMPLLLTLLGTVVVSAAGLTQHFQRASNFPAGLPQFTVPFSSWSVTVRLLPEALKITLVSFSEALMTTKTIAQKENYRVATSHELFALSATNCLTPWLSGLASFMSLVRTPLNAQLGSQSQLCGLLSGVTILLFACFGSSLIQLVPIPLISAIVAYSALFNVLDLTLVINCYRNYKKDFLMFLVTFILALALPLADALLLSAIISLLWILKRNSKPTWCLQRFQLDEDQEQEYYDSQDDSSDVSNREPCLPLREDNQHSTVPQEFINKIVSIASMHSISAPDQDHLSINDLCFCHDLRCPQRCHILVIQLQGHLSYVNCKQLQEQAEYMSDFIRADDNPLADGPLEKGDGLQVKALIYDCTHLSSVDYSALTTLLRLKELLQRRRIVCRFSALRPELRNHFDHIHVLESSGDETKSVLYNIYATFQGIISSNSALPKVDSALPKVYNALHKVHSSFQEENS